MENEGIRMEEDVASITHALLMVVVCSWMGERGAWVVVVVGCCGDVGCLHAL